MIMTIPAKRVLTVLFVCISPLCSLFAQQGTMPLPLQQAIELTLQHYPAIAAKAALVKAGEAHVTDVRHDWWPSLKLHEQVDAGTDNSIYGSYFSMGLLPSTSGGIRSANRSDIMSGNIALASLQWEVYNFGAYRSRREEAQQQLKIQAEDMANARNDIVLTVIRHYFGLLQYQALLSIQADNIGRTAQVRQAVTAIVLHGLKPGVDSAIAAAELSKARLAYLDVLNRYNETRSRLAVLTGLDTASIRPDTMLAASLSALLQQAADTLSTGVRHPLLRYYGALSDQSRAREQVIRRQALPKLYLMAAGWARGSSGQYEDVFNKNLWSGLGYSRYNYLAGMGLTYNLADIGHTRDKLTEQRFRTEAATQQLETARRNLYDLLQQAQVNIRTSLDKLRELPVQLSAARAAAAQKMALYKGGLTNIIEVTNALYVLNRAETDLVQTRSDAWQSLLGQAFAGDRLAQLLQSLN
jgi:adhesin transport system outer membrane protein